MSAVSSPRGPLPARVYWVRRFLVLVLASALVLAIGYLLSGGGPSPQTPSPRPAAAGTASASSGPTPSAGNLPGMDPRNEPSEPAKANEQGGKGADRGKATRTPLAVPTGPCVDSDVAVVPSVKGDAFAITDVDITLTLSTLESPACTWQVSPESVVVGLTSGSDAIWTTQQCPGAIPQRSVVLRKEEPVRLMVTWSGMRSDDDCTRTTPWARPGYYHVSAAAYGAEPADVQFELLRPETRTVTPEPTPRVPADQKNDRVRGQH